MIRNTLLSLALAGILASSSTAENVTWQGADATNPTFWDQTTANWTGDFSTYLDGDDVTFDDSASSFLVEVQSDVLPKSVTFSNTINTYTINPAGGNISFDDTLFPGSTGITLGANSHVISGMSAGNQQPVSLGTGSVLELNRTGYGFFRYVFSGDGSLEMNGTNSVDLGRDSPSYDGNITVNGGTAISRFLTGFGNATGSLTVNNGATARYTDFNASANMTSGTINKAVSLNDGSVFGISRDSSLAVADSGLITMAGGITLGGTGGRLDSSTGREDNGIDPEIIGVTYTGGISGTGDLEMRVGTDDLAVVDSNISVSGGLTKGAGGTLRLNAGHTYSYSGPTTIDGGTLEIASGATLPANDVVANGGSFDVTASGLTIPSGTSLSGNGGTVTGATTVQSGGTLSVGNGQLSGVNETQTTSTYIDAGPNTTGLDGNTTLADGTLLTEGSVGFDHAVVADDLWDYRDGTESGPFGNDSGIWQSGGTGSEDAPRLRTTISGLSPGSSNDIFAYFWGIDGISMRGRASLTDEAGDLPGYNTRHTSGSSFSPMTGVTRLQSNDGGLNPGPVSTADESGIEDGGYFTNSVLTEEGTWALFEVQLGTEVTDGSGNVHVYIDDLANTTNGNRTWYDGVGYGTTTTLPTLVDNIQVLTVDGDLDLNASSSLEIEVLAENVFDKLVVTGELTANGALDVIYGDGTPLLEDGDSIDILDFDTIVGTFSSVNLPTLSGGLSWDQSALLTDGILSVVSGAGLDGDFNNDGTVDAADYAAWRDGLGTTYVQADYITWRNNYGMSSAAEASPAAAPEPAALLSLLAAACGACCLRRR